MSLLKTFLVLSILLTTSNSWSQKNKTENKINSDSLSTYLEITKVPAISYAEIKNFKPFNNISLGLIKADSVVAVDDETVFEAASLTKPLVAYCALKFVEKDLLDLDRPPYTYLVYSDALHDKRYKLITARMILSHTSGFPNWRKKRNGDTLNIRFDPGEKFGYSGEGFVYLQKVLENISKKDLNTIVSEMIFIPSEMKRSSLLFSYDKNYAIGHDSDRIPKKKHMPQKANAAYSLHTTASDYTIFLSTLGQSIASKLMATKQDNTESVDKSRAWGLGAGLYFTKNGK